MLESPLAEALNATATGTLAELDELKWKDGYANGDSNMDKTAWVSGSPKRQLNFISRPNLIS